MESGEQVSSSKRGKKIGSVTGRVGVLYSATNDPETASDPRPQMIPKLDANDPRTTNDPHSGPQMIPVNNRNGVDNRTAMTL